jgi:hypothetical protein
MQLSPRMTERGDFFDNHCRAKRLERRPEISNAFLHEKKSADYPA